MATFVIVGGGLAAAKAVEGLRAGGFEDRIVLVGAEHHLPYERPPLSKGYLLGTEGLDQAFVHPPEWYDEHEVDLRLGAPATGIDLDAIRIGTRNVHLTQSIGPVTLLFGEPLAKTPTNNRSG